MQQSIFGEENNTFCNKLGEKISVEIKESQEKTADLLKIVLNQDGHAADLLAGEVHRNVRFEDVDVGKVPGNFDLDLGNIGIWIDPIGG